MHEGLQFVPMQDLAFIVAGLAVGLIVVVIGVIGVIGVGGVSGGSLETHLSERSIRSALSVLLAYAGLKLIAL